ncbi:MAG: glycosyltransferase family 39 protein [Candidatus Sumerlaeia bacterium]|nr:glycosyltransferase family 39 protein [Candidatus Sumerlaeia bacterium]
MPQPLRSEIACLCFLVVLGAALRWPGLAGKAFWIDEIQAVERSQSLQQAIQYGALHHEPPLRYVLLHYLTRLQPVELFARLPSFLFALATIPLLWLLVRRSLGQNLRPPAPADTQEQAVSERDRAVLSHAALAAAFLLAVSPWHIFHSQDARMYGVMMFFWTLSLILFFGAVENPRQPLWWPGLAAVHAVNFHLSYLTVFVLAGEALALAGWLIRRKWREGKAFALQPYGVGALIFAGFFGLMTSFWFHPLTALFERYADVRAARVPPAARATYELLREQWPAELGAGFFIAVLDKILIPGLAGSLASLVGFCAGAVLLGRRQPLLVAVGVLSVGLALAAMWQTSARYFAAPRYVFHLLLFAILAYAWLIVSSAHALAGTISKTRPLRAQASVVIAACLGLGLLLAPTLLRQVRTEKQDWRGAVRFLEQFTQPGDTLLTGLWGTHQALLYYSPAEMLSKLTVRNCLSAETTWRELRATTGSATVWYVTWGYIPRELDRVLRPAMQCVGVFTGLEGRIYVYCRRRP